MQLAYKNMATSPTPNVTTTMLTAPDILRSSPLQALQPPSPSRPNSGSLLVARNQLLQSPRTTKEYLPNELLLALRKQQQHSLAEPNHLPPVKSPQVDLMTAHVNALCLI